MGDVNQLGIPYERHSASSKAAAERIKPFVHTARYRVYDYIANNSRCSDQDIRTALSMNIKTVSPRRIELEHAGLIRPCGLNARAATLFEATGKPYPAPWPKSEYTFQKRRSERPTPQEFLDTVEDVRAAYQVMTAQGAVPFRGSTIKVLQWLARQSQ